LLFPLVVVVVGVFYGAGESMFGLSFELSIQIETTTIKYINMSSQPHNSSFRLLILGQYYTTLHYTTLPHSIEYRGIPVQTVQWSRRDR
jgi:hypothetical protein